MAGASGLPRWCHIGIIIGVGGSRTLAEVDDDEERYFGLENFGNTCYCNAVLQSLYFCKPFRQRVMAFTAVNQNEESLLTSLAELFSKIALQKKHTGVLQPRKFVAELRKENESFRGYMQQDAHEFLNYLLNAIAETLLREKKLIDKRQGKDAEADAKDDRPASARPPATWIHELFEGFLTNETKCLCCENVTNRDESFFDLSVDIEQNSSVTGCLRNFSSSETLCHKDKFFCDVCSSLQEAEKRMKIKKLPNVLALQLKRFKFTDTGYRKLSYRVVFPLELRLFNTSDDCADRDRCYELFAVVIHIGSGPNQGHYVAIVKSGRRWLVFDDDQVEPIDERGLQTFFGTTSDLPANTDCVYLLFYQSTHLSAIGTNGDDHQNPTVLGAPNGDNHTSTPGTIRRHKPGLAGESLGGVESSLAEEAERRTSAKHDGTPDIAMRV